jgi:hypothetical protein
MIVSKGFTNSPQDALYTLTPPEKDDTVDHTFIGAGVTRT